MKTIRRLTASLFALGLIANPCLGQAHLGRAPGINLGAGVLAYDNSTLIFADLIRGAGTFNGFRGVEPVPAYDAKGWPTRVDASTGPTSLVVALYADLPVGWYTLTAKGVGRVRLSGGFDGQFWREVTFNGDGLPRRVYLPTGGVPRFWQIEFMMVESRASNPIRDVSFVLPGHVGRTFYQRYLDDLKPFSTLRIMDWQATNGSKQVNWSDRTASQKFSYRGRGRIEEETACELANLLGKDLWICIPALASDDYVRRLARLVDQHLDPRLRLYVEFSNEVWNTGMPQWSQLMALRDQNNQGLGAWEWIARRDGRLVNLFKSRVSPSRACIRVLARQAGYQATLTVALKQYQADGYRFDAISCAGYFVSKTNLNTATTQYKTNPSAAVTSVINGLYGSIPEIAAQVAWYKAKADWYGVPLVLYEGGQHVNYWQNDNATPLLIAVNRDPRMGLAYSHFINALPSSIGGVCWYADSGTYSKWGCWGLKERTGQSSATAHKYRAVTQGYTSGLTVAAPPPSGSHVSKRDTMYSGMSSGLDLGDYGWDGAYQTPEWTGDQGEIEPIGSREDQP
ncbi:hypothetical protein P12x_005399 [Tundrisphaera lichenicola]|uniref:hypothetical protein n=1 Tax=Tundrisphaera lichenicola TaxID=2029860 RepID=UPI003EB9E74B